MKEDVVSREMISEALSGAGIGQGESVGLHSSLKSLGFVEGGPETVIRAFQDVLTSTGTFIMPTHSYSLPMWQKPPYRRDESPSVVGKITEVFRNMPGVIRSEHPTHSVAAWGELAEHFTEDGLKLNPVGENGPWHRLAKVDGTILMLGCDLRSCTILHLCETMASVPYLDVAFTKGQDYETAHRINEREEVEEFILKPVPGCSKGFNNAEDYLRKKGVLKDVKILNAESMILPAKDILEVMTDKLKTDPAFLLCEDPKCGICPRRRNRIE